MLIHILIMFGQTFLLAELAFLAMRRWDGGWLRLLAAHAISLAISWAWFAFGSSDGRVYLAAGMVYVFPQGLWLVVGYLRGKSAREA
jgi:hypothetical protein